MTENSRRVVTKVISVKSRLTGDTVTPEHAADSTKHRAQTPQPHRGADGESESESESDTESETEPEPELEE